MKKYKLINLFGLDLPILFPKYNILHFKICCSNGQKFKYFVSHVPIWIVNIAVLYFFVECSKSLLLENIFVVVKFMAVLANFTVETISNNFIFYFFKEFSLYVACMQSNLLLHFFPHRDLPNSELTSLKKFLPSDL